VQQTHVRCFSLQYRAAALEIQLPGYACGSAPSIGLYAHHSLIFTETMIKIEECNRVLGSLDEVIEP